MLQQTQTFRVVPKFEAFIKKFPTIQALAKAPLPQVLKLWQGLGYNRRALMLHRAAQSAMLQHSGVVPRTYDKLLELPGIGPYTAGAVMAFAYNEPAAMIETNIRSAIIHEFFPEREVAISKKGCRELIHDDEVLAILKKAVPKDNAREFYQALMDYGAFIKQKYPNPSRRSAHHVKQSQFEGSRRQVRGRLLSILLSEPRLSAAELARIAAKPVELVAEIADQLVSEGFLVKKSNQYSLLQK